MTQYTTLLSCSHHFYLPSLNPDLRSRQTHPPLTSSVILSLVLLFIYYFTLALLNTTYFLSLCQEKRKKREAEDQRRSGSLSSNVIRDSGNYPNEEDIEFSTRNWKNEVEGRSSSSVKRRCIARPDSLSLSRSLSTSYVCGLANSSLSISCLNHHQSLHSNGVLLLLLHHSEIKLSFYNFIFSS